MSQFASRAASSYLQTEVQSRTPLELVVMLYDGAIRFLSSARSAIERNDIAARREGISRALAVISELQSTLDMDQGGDMAKSLDSLYTYLNGRLIDASFKKDVQPIDEALKVLNTLRGAWADIAAQQPAAAPAQASR
jgi:flagellar protein FliS